MNDDMPLAKVLSKLNNPKFKSGEWWADCPNCRAQNRPHLSVKQGDKAVILTCWGGCDTQDVLGKLGLAWADLYVATPGGNGGKPAPPAGLGSEDSWPIVARYNYVDGYGQELYQVQRKEPKGYEGRGIKTFRQATKSADGWKSGLSVADNQLVLYRLPYLYTSSLSQWVFVVEGEKSADALAETGLIVTTSLSGAKGSKKHWESGHYPGQLKGRKVAVIADNDEPGRNFASLVKRTMLEHGEPSDLRVILELPGLAHKQDVYDWLKLGNTRDELLALVENARNELAGPWEWKSLADAYQDRPPRGYIVDEVLTLPSLSIWYGYPGDLKSMLLLDLACCVAGGKPWLTGLPGRSEPDFAYYNEHYNADSDAWGASDVPTPTKAYSCKKSAVMWLDVDNGDDRTARRIAALGKTHGVPNDAPFYYLSFPSPPFLGDNQECVEQLIKNALDFDSKLIIIDNLLAVSGAADENSSQIGAVMAGLREIAELTGAAVVVIHHRTKTKSDRSGNDLRGHSSIEGSVDLALKVDRNPSARSEVALTPTKSRDTLFRSFGALWCYESDGNELKAGRFFGTGHTAPDSKKAADKAQDIICNGWHTSEIATTTEIVEFCKENGIGRNSTLEGIGKLVASGKLVLLDETGAKGANQYQFAV